MRSTLRGTTGAELSRGCGYVRASYSGDVGDKWGEVYDETSSALVYGWNNGRLSSGCTAAVTAGTLPDCSAWTEVTCADLQPDAGPSKDAGREHDAAPEGP